jgi:branched-chain amino acid aminotransferase
MTDPCCSDPGPLDGWGWMDGDLRLAREIVVSAFDRTLLYGLGAFETVRLWNGVAYLLDRHLERLHRSLAAVGLPQPAALAAVAEGIHALASRMESPSVLARITVTAGSSTADAQAGGMRVIIGLREVPDVTAGGLVEVGIADFAHDTRSPLTGVKSTSYLVHYLLRERAERAGRVDDLMVDIHGRVTEATVSNVFGVRAGLLVTPPLSEGILEGVTRGRVLELAAGIGIQARQEPLLREALTALDECFLTGAGKCVLPIDVLDGRRLSGARPVSDQLAVAMARDVAERCGVDPADVQV